MIYCLSLYSSNFQTNVQRNYQKIQSLLADLGGICNFLFLFGFVICNFENKYKLVSLLSNELFIFPTIQQKSNLTEPNLNSKNSHKLISLPISDKILENENQKEFSKDDHRILQSEYVSKIAPSFPKETHSILKLKKIDLYENIKESNEDEGINPKNRELKPKILVFHEIQTNQNSNENKNPKDDALSHGSEVNNSILKSMSPFGINIWKTKLRSVTNLFSIKSINSPDSQMIGKLDNYQILKKKENIFSLGFAGFLIIQLKKKMLCFYKKMTNREKLFRHAEEEIADELHIIKILKKLQDVEKLKRILLNDDQFYLFNLLSKPMIILENSSKQEKEQDINTHDQRFKFSHKDNLNLEKMKLFEIYKSVKAKENDSQIDQKLIKLLDEDVMSFLKNEKLIE